MSRFATLGRTAAPIARTPPPDPPEYRPIAPRAIALAALSTSLAGIAAFAFGALLVTFPRSGIALLGPVAFLAVAMDRVRQRIYWPMLAPLLTNHTTVQELALLPNPSSFLVSWVRRADDNVLHHLQTRTPHFAAILFVLLSFHASTNSILHVAELTALCTLSWFATRVLLYRQVEALREVDILGATGLLVQLAAKSAGVPVREKVRVGRPPRAVIAFNPILILFLIVVIFTLLKMESPSDALAAFALVLLPAMFPVAVALCRPQVQEMKRTSETEANWLIGELGRKVAEIDLAAK